MFRREDSRHEANRRHRYARLSALLLRLYRACDNAFDATAFVDLGRNKGEKAHVLDPSLVPLALLDPER